MPEECWAAVRQAPGYRVSTEGNVTSKRFGQTKLLAQSVDRGGYHRVALYVNQRRRYYSVHRLVLEAFVGPCPPGEEGLHEDDNKSNNRLSNLRWGTRVENKKDQRKNGRQPEGETNGQSKLTEALVREIRARRKLGESLPKLAKAFNVTSPTIYHVCAYNTWKHVKE